MADVRTQLYSTYVSTFKDENVGLTDADRESFYHWCDARYLPSFQHLPKDARILELGCGHGRMLRYLRDRGYTNVTGIDVSEEQIEIAREQGLDAHVADLFDVLDTAEGIDCVLAIDLLEHFSKEELMRLCTGVHQALKPSGIFLIQTVNGEGLFPRQIIYGDLTHMTILTPGSMSQLLRSTGFTITDMHEAAPLRNGLKGLIRTGVWAFVKMLANSIRTIEAGKRQAIWTENFITTAKRS